jgi:uncharacterized protein YjbI with pentapeptide repeats
VVYVGAFRGPVQGHPGAAMPVTENTEYEAAFEDPDDFGSARTFRRCVFQNFTFATTRDAVFDECTFRTVTFGGDGLRDSQATGCTFHETRFLPAAGISDVTFRKCVFTKLTGAWRARRCSWTECTFANVRFEPRAAVLLQCRLRDCQVADTTALASQWTDCALRAVTFERCALERAVWRRCAARGVRFDACALGSVAFGGNTWDACAWKDCGAAHAGFVGDRLSQCRVVAMKAPSARFSACEMVAVRDEGSDYSFSRWEATDLVDCPWIRVNLTEARCNKVTWTNCTHEAVRDVNALYSNVAHVKKPTVEGRVHFCGGGGAAGGGAPPSITTTLFSKHWSLHATEMTAFRLRLGVAQEVDFVAVKPTPSWWAFGFSAAPDAHDIVSHVTIGARTYYPSGTPYTIEGGNGGVVGYRLRTVQRAHSR